MSQGKIGAPPPNLHVRPDLVSVLRGCLDLLIIARGGGGGPPPLPLAQWLEHSPSATTSGPPLPEETQQSAISQVSVLATGLQNHFWVQLIFNYSVKVEQLP